MNFQINGVRRKATKKDVAECLEFLEREAAHIAVIVEAYFHEEKETALNVNRTRAADIRKVTKEHALRIKQLRAVQGTVPALLGADGEPVN